MNHVQLELLLPTYGLAIVAVCELFPSDAARHVRHAASDSVKISDGA
jgi:hypothetical protein